MLSSCCTLVFEKAQQNFRRLVRKRRQAFVRLSDKGIGFLDKAVSCGDAQRPVEMMKPRLKNPLNREGLVGEVRSQWGLKLRHASDGSTAWVVHCYMYMRAVLETVEDRVRTVIVVQVERIGRLFNKENRKLAVGIVLAGRFEDAFGAATTSGTAGVGDIVRYVWIAPS